MKKQKISDIISNINENIVEEATTYRNNEKKSADKKPWLKWGAIAACLILVTATVAVLPILSDSGKNITSESNVNQNNSENNAEEQNHTSIGGLLRPYKDVAYSSESSARVWEWEYLTLSEQYTSVNYNGKVYEVSGEIDKAYIGESLGTYEATGYDIYTDKTYNRTFEIYSVNNVDSNAIIALLMGEEYYVYMEGEYNPPATFGAFIDKYNLSQNLEFHKFSENVGYSENAYYITDNNNAIWELLSECTDAVFIQDDLWDLSEREYLCFTATSEILGFYKRVVYVTADGYFATNIFDWLYIFDIGEEYAQKIIECATENATETEFEPYTNSLAGTISEIGEGYILIDDSILCENSDDGITFRISTEDLRISRYIDSGTLSLGDIVSVSFHGEIDTANGNAVNDVWSISKARISDGEVWIAE